MMKKLTALALTVALVLTVSLASALVLEPEGYEIDRLAGATVHASFGAYSPEDKTFTVMVCDYDRYDPEEVARLKVGDTILAGGYLYEITGEENLEDTHVFLCDGGEEIYFDKSYDGDDDLIARSTTDDRIFMNVVTVLHLPAAENIVYEDNSDPDLDAKPVVASGLEAVLKAKEEKEKNSNGFNAYAITMTLNENMEIVKIHQDYDVAQ